MGKDCNGCKRDIYSFSGTHDLLKFATQDPVGVAPKLTPKPDLINVAKPAPVKDTKSDPISPSVYSKNKETYWKCWSCSTVNATRYGGQFSSCDKCLKETSKNSPKIDPSS